MNRRPMMMVSLALATGTSAAGADWPNFRGPNHDGISNESGLRVDWKDPIPFVWDRNVGSAFSSFACVDKRLYTCGTQDGKQVLFCLDADDGRVVWQNAFEPEYREPQGGDGTRATPTVHDGRVYILGASGRLVCMDAATGAEHWSKQFNHRPQWGYSASVLVEGDMIVTTAGRDQGAIVAFDRVSGAPIWQAGDEPPGYCTPYPFTMDGKRYIVGFTGKSVLIVEARTGREVWRQEWKTSFDVNAAAPIFHDGHLFITSGYDTGSGLFKLRTDGDKLAGEEVWRSKVLLSKFQSAVLHDGKLYASDQNSLACVDFMTGKEEWRQRRVRNGTMTLAQGNLFLLTEEGQLQIAPPSPGGWEPVTAADILSDRCWSAPVIHRGRLYVRNLERVACFDIRASRAGGASAE